MGVQRPIGLPQGASSLSGGVDENKSYSLVSVYPEACFKLMTEIHSPTLSPQTTGQDCTPACLSKNSSRLSEN